MGFIIHKKNFTYSSYDSFLTCIYAVVDWDSIAMFNSIHTKADLRQNALCVWMNFEFRFPQNDITSAHAHQYNIWRVLYQKYVSRAGTSNYISRILGDVITCPHPWYLLLIQHSSYMWTRSYSNVSPSRCNCWKHPRSHNRCTGKCVFSLGLTDHNRGHWCIIHMHFCLDIFCTLC